jgi:hypothetical protein
MLVKFFLCLALFVPKIFCSSEISYREEKKKIMAEYHELHSNHLAGSGHYIIEFTILEKVFKMNPVDFLRELRKEKDKIFILTLWNTFRTNWVFLSNHKYYNQSHKGFREFISQVSMATCNKVIASDMLYHFKVYLMQALTNWDSDNAGMLLEAKNFFDIRLKKLILEVLKMEWDTTNDLIREMDQNFRFYQLCTNKDHIKHLLTWEFGLFKSALALNKKTQYEIHAENMTFLAGILKNDRSTIFGLNLISDLSSEFVGLFLLMQLNQDMFLKRIVFLKHPKPQNYQRLLINFLHKTIPIFENPSLLPGQFTPKKEFINHFADILKDDNELVELARTIFEKILLY